MEGNIQTFTDAVKNLYYDETSPSCLRWACDIPRQNQTGVIEGSYIRRAGDIAGTLASSGRVGNRYRVKFQQQVFMAHRIIYTMFHGDIQEDFVVDHIDGNGCNNKISNLRAVPQSINCRNTQKRANSVTGHNGVTFSTVANKYGVYYYYTATWVHNGKIGNKYFSIEKFGKDEALRLATEYRAKMIAEMNAAGAGYTDDHGIRNSH